MASNFATSYIHNQSTGNFDSCKRYQDSVGDIIQNLFDQGQIMGFQMIIIENESQELNELIPSHDHIVKDKYPYLFIRIQPNEDGTLDVDELMNQHDSTKIK